MKKKWMGSCGHPISERLVSKEMAGQGTAHCPKCDRRVGVVEKTEEVQILESLQCVPTKPKEWRKQLRRLVEMNGAETVAKKLGFSIEELEEKMMEKSEAEDWQTYKVGLKKCVEKNSRFTLEEIAEILGVKVEDLQ